MVESAGVVNQVGLVLRHSPSYRWLQHNAQSGQHGTPMSLIFRDDQYIPVQGMYASTWRGDKALAGAGTLLEHSIHDLDLIEWTLGDIVQVSAMTNNAHGIDGIEDQASVMLIAESGAHAVLSSTWHDIMSRPSLRSVELLCREAAFMVQGDWLGPVTEHMSGGASMSYDGDQLKGMLADVDEKSLNPDADFVAAILGGYAAAPGFAVALRAHVLADAAYTSASEGGSPQMV